MCANVMPVFKYTFRAQFPCFSIDPFSSKCKVVRVLGHTDGPQGLLSRDIGCNNSQALTYSQLTLSSRHFSPLLRPSPQCTREPRPFLLIFVWSARLIMASQSQGIQQLLQAEKRAAEKVAEARKRK